MGSVPVFKGRRSLILIFVFIWIGIGTLGFFYYEHQKKILKKEKWLQLSVIADLKARQIVNWFNERLGDAATILESPFLAKHVDQFLKNPGSSSIKQEILNLMTSFQKNNQYQQISLLDAKGRVLLSTQEELEGIVSYVKPLVLEAIVKKRVAFSDFYRHEQSRRIFINFIAPISDPKRPDAPSVGAFLLRIDPQQFLYPLIRSNSTTSRSLESVLVRREGNEITFLSEINHLEDAPLSFRFKIKEKLSPSEMDTSKRELIFESLDYRGVPVLTSLRHFEDLPWSLIVKIDQDEVYAPIRSRAILIATLIGLLITGGGLAMGLIWRHQHAKYQRRYDEVELERQALAEHFDYLTRYANDIILLMDRNFKIIEANDRAVETYGYTREELLQMDLKDLRAPETRSTLESHTALLKEQNGIILETQHQRKDGTKFPVESSLRIIEKEGRRFYQNITRNITDRKQTEETQHFLHRLLEISYWQMGMIPLLTEFVAEIRRFTGCAAVGIRLLDKEGKIPYQAYEGFSQSFYESESPLSIESDECMCINIIKGNLDPMLPFYTEVGSFYMNGTTRFLATIPEEQRDRTRNVCNEAGYESIALVPIRQENQIAGLIHVADPRENMVPLSLVKELEKAALQLGTAIQRIQFGEALRLSEERFRRVAESNTIGIVFVDGNCKVTSANDAFLHLIGYTREELLEGKINWREINPQELFPFSERALQEIKSFDHCTPFEIEFIRKDGSSVPVLVGGALLNYSKQEYVGFALDLTERKWGEELLRRSEQRAIHLCHENAAMAEIGRIISSTFDIEEVYERFAEEVAKLISFDHIGICTLNQNGKTLTVNYSSGINIPFRPPGAILNLSGTISEQILKTKSPLIFQTEDENEVAAWFPGLLPSFRAGNRSTMAIPLISKDQAIGVIIFHSKKPNAYTETDVELGERVGNQIAGTIANVQLFIKQKRIEKERERLLKELAQNQGQLRNLSRRLVEVQEVERRRLSIELHDRIGQNLAAMNIHLNFIKNHLSIESMERIGTLLENFLKLVDDSMKHARNIMTDLRPPVLDDYGLAAALRWYCGQLSAQSGLSITFNGEEFVPRLPLNIEDTLFRIAQEALNNVIKHAQAKNVTIFLEHLTGMVCLTIVDDGLGFDPALENHLDHYPKLGLITMRERALAVNGNLCIESQPGKGTKVIVKIPHSQ